MALSLVQRSAVSYSPGGSDGKPVTTVFLDVVDDSGGVIATFSKNGFALTGFDLPGAVSGSGGGLHVAHAKYDFAVNAGAVSTIAPANSDTIPDNAIIIGGTINVTTACLSSGSATVAIGTSAGSSTTALLAATAKASLSADAVINAVPVLATPVKMTAAGTVTFTIGTAALTAGVIEAWFYYVSAAA